jgi:hypothetical protein
MKRPKHWIPLTPCAVVAAGALAGALPAGAEVAAVLSPEMRLVDVRVTLSQLTGGAWAKDPDTLDFLVLNPDGDQLRDPLPTAGVIWMPMEDPTRDRLTGGPAGEDLGGTGPSHGGDPTDGKRGPLGQRLPTTGEIDADLPEVDLSALVVWSRFDGTDHDIVYSLWDPKRLSWRPIGYVKSDNQVDDVQPQLTVRGGIAYLTWRVVSPDRVSQPWFTRGQVVYQGNGNGNGNSRPEMRWEPPQPLTVDVEIELIAPPEEAGASSGVIEG